MTAATINKINKEISDLGVEIVKGYGYFYFADLPASDDFNADVIDSVWSCHLRCMTLEEWVAHVRGAFL